ncbi:dihydrolipoyl dehydrogenase [Empedobacter brevis]|uniref:Dihydrolipoyl dehydrogenase n=2 Tax=Empedobacter brevis TaxID=247 RepID=A0A511NIL3_9FLAO|nr:dihydrolipoyl dehydrogenase [Empedobacter brevis]MDM1071525.1 dihydrolipoyl dehydrogenase [Empedobacter brevis]QES93819.1 dihydrolipoyl dehydrogenase [Empedobacter brevis]QHC85676.1 dihydrolipoamide dehydrogenase [Empedobacter brevis]GEM52649.1 dihydrolipoyl dehydrogenase [Empedobacter brevis NBRC 14943 = ATCC 43319]
MSSYDVAVIGAGPGGYVAAIRCAQLGFKTAIIEKENLGGTCLNVGCIPSKALLDSSHHFYDAVNHFKEHGIEIDAPKVNFTQMITRKQGVVDTNVAGIKYLMSKNNIDVLEGAGAFKDATHIVVTAKDGSTQEIEAKNTIIATGSVSSELPFAPTDKTRIITSTEALALTEVPKHLIVIGGGVIGLELGSVYLRLGSDVTVVEYADRVIPGMDGALSKELTKVLKKQGMKFYTSTGVTSVVNNGNDVTLKATSKKGEEIEINGDYALVAVGRRAFTGSLGLENVGIEVDERGRIKTNDHLQTNVSNVYAIGDVVAGAMLAHKAEEEGVLVAEQLAGQKPHINYNLIPGVVYTWPEVAGVGKTEEQLKEEGVEYKVGSFPFKALGRARASMDTDGFAKILADKNTDEILGMHIIGARAADLIAEGVTAMEFRASAEDLTRMSHAHPTFAEAIKEAALAATDNRAIHA